ncbi:hypothetical protein LOD99_4937 [Oopsacas minuta]|uniref:Uncharacterized protein n=1 Tax=Oopsacas minuta TaxID=111878 RepID=A0AAV7JS31_9METZ|nr:hypothetical protein LOD99_4937 [Oopsacas minuta]
MKLFVIALLLTVISNAQGNEYNSYRNKRDIDLSSIEREMQEVKAELSMIESEIQSMENMNSDTNNNNFEPMNNDMMGPPNTDVDLSPPDDQSSYEMDNNNQDNNQDSSQPNVYGDITGENTGLTIDGIPIFEHVSNHYKRNKYIIWIILGVASLLAIIACPSWVLCCIGVYFYKKHQKARKEEKFSYDATSDSDEEPEQSTGIGGSLVRKITTVSQKRRKGTYEPLKAVEDS